MFHCYTRIKAPLSDILGYNEVDIFEVGQKGIKAPLSDI